MNRGIISKCLVSLAVLVLAGCGLTVTKVHSGHQLLHEGGGDAFATVYFLRPFTEHPQGFADNLLTVELDGAELMQLGKGEYAMVRLKPRQVTVTLRNYTQATGRWQVKPMSRSQGFQLDAGVTYYIVTRAVDGEFRGVAFVPERVEAVAAKELARHLHPAGAARDARL